MTKVNYSYKKYNDDGMECPVCGSKFVSTSYYEMAKHLAKTGNLKPLDEHRRWRMKNRIQADSAYPHEIDEMITKIMDLMQWG